MDRKLPDIDIPEDFIIGLVGVDITEDILGLYQYPCRLKAGIFVLCLQGTFEATINLSQVRVERHDFVSITPGSVIQIHPVKGDFRAYFMGFSSTCMEKVNLVKSIDAFYTLFLENPVLRLAGVTADVYERYFSFVYDTYNKGMLTNPEIIQCLLVSTLYGINDLYREQVQDFSLLSRGETICQQFLRLVRMYYEKERSVSFYAGLLHISPQHLCATVKKIFHQTASDVIASVVIMDAKAQLKSTNLTIQEISVALNFPSLSFFGKYFKRQTGLSPQEYRRN